MMKSIVALLVTFALVSGQSYPLYSQCDGQWGSETLGGGPNTICQAGCAMTSLSMALAGQNLSVNGNTATPDSLNSWLNSNGGFSGDLLVWGAVSSLGLSYNGKVSASSVPSNIDAGNVVILNVRYGAHWVLMTSYSGTTFSVNDPGYSNTSYDQSQVTQAAVYSVSSSSSFLRSSKFKNFSE